MSEQQTKSHSELFGLDPTNNSEHEGHKEPGSAISGTVDPVKEKNSGPGPAGGSEGTDSKVGGVDAPGGGSERPGAGSSTVTPSQGGNKVGDSNTGVLGGDKN